MNVSGWKLFRTVLKNSGEKKLNRKMIGHAIEQQTAPLAKSENAAFGKAIKDELQTGETTHPFIVSRLIIPIMKQIWVHPDLNMNIMKMVHASQEINWHTPIDFDHPIHIKAAIANITDTPVGELMEITSECSQQNLSLIHI